MFMSRQKAAALYWMLYMGTYSARSHWISDSPESGVRSSMRAPATARAWRLHADGGGAAAAELAGGGVGSGAGGSPGAHHCHRPWAPLVIRQPLQCWLEGLSQVPVCRLPSSHPQEGQHPIKTLSRKKENKIVY